MNFTFDSAPRNQLLHRQVHLHVHTSTHSQEGTVVTPRDNGGELLGATEGRCLRKDVDSILLGVGGDDEGVIRHSEGRVSRAVQKNLHTELEHRVQLALTNYLHSVARATAAAAATEPTRVSSMHDKG